MRTTASSVRSSLMVLALAGCSERPASRPQPEPAAKVQRVEAADVERVNVPVSGQEPSRGPAIAPITVVVFSDFECPFCARAESTLDALAREYGPRMRIVWRNSPLPSHPHARLAAEAAMAAHAQDADKFWAMHDRLFAQQSALTEQALKSHAKALGLDEKRFADALAAHTFSDAVEADRQLGERLGAQATPVFFINGRPLQGAQPTATFKALIDDELQRVTIPLAKGLPQAELYTAMVAQGAASARFESAPPARSPVPATVYNLAVSKADPQRGPADALITYILFGDVADEWTERALITLSAVEKKHGNALRVVWKNVPMAFNEHARDAARIGMAAFASGGSELFWKANELLRKNRSMLTRSDLARYAEQLGLDDKEVRAALDDGKYDAKIDEDLEQAKQVVFGLTTPIIAVNGRVFKGAQSFEINDQLIQEELPKARARIASGVPLARLYDELVKDGKLHPFEVAPGTTSADAKKVHAIAAPAQAPRRGAANAKIVIQEFADFECAFCREVEPTLRQLLQENPEVELIWRNEPLPIHTNASLAAEAAQEAFAQGGNAKFWAYHDLLFANQSALARADLERYAQQLSLDLRRFRAALEDGRHLGTLKADQAAVAQIGEQVGTPAFLVNGLLIAGAQPIEVFKVALQRALLRRAAASSR